MNPIVKQKWVAALRSGEFVQSRQSLRNEKGYCCLGVLCDIAVKEGIIPEPTLSVFSGEYTYAGGNTSYLPQPILSWADLSYRNPAVSRGSLANVNDDGSSFEEIANLIEAQL